MDESWKPFLKSEFEKPYFLELSNFLHTAYEARTVFPPKAKVFAAFKTNLNEIKVVILGQDPYHTPGVADGLAFSTAKGCRIPPSLKNIYKEIDMEFSGNSDDAKFAENGVGISESFGGGKISGHQNPDGNLLSWQKQGVLLLNTVLTVEAHAPKSHSGKGWEIFTTEVIKYLNEKRKGLVFMLWGRDAREKRNLIDAKKHLILEAAHPSPFSANNGFFGCGHFKKCNEYLEKQGKAGICW